MNTRSTRLMLKGGALACFLRASCACKCVCSHSRDTCAFEHPHSASFHPPLLTPYLLPCLVLYDPLAPPPIHDRHLTLTQPRQIRRPERPGVRGFSRIARPPHLSDRRRLCYNGVPLLLGPPERARQGDGSHFVRPVSRPEAGTPEHPEGEGRGEPFEGGGAVGALQRAGNLHE